MLRRAIGITGTIVMLAAAAVVVPQRSKADSTKDVLVVNAPNQPVPVSGNVAIGGTANVDVTNTPNVNVASLPAVQLAAGTSVGISGTPNVNVANQPTVRLAPDTVVAAVNANARQLVQTLFEMDIVGGKFQNAATMYTVPPGKRFVLEDVSGHALLPTGQKLVIAELVLQDPPRITEFPVSFSGTTFGVDWFLFGRTARGYANPGASVQAIAQRSDSSGDAQVIFNLSGYLVDLP
jgi:hypothetical protein